MNKKIVVGLLSSSILFLVACNNQDKTEEVVNESIDLTNLELPLEDKITLKGTIGSSPLAPENPNDKLIFKRLEEETNVHVEWTNYTNDFAEKRNLDISAGDLPDFIWNAAASDSDILQWSRNGVIVPLEDLIESHMPNLKKIFEDYPHYKQMSMAPDGHIYTLPWIEELGEGPKSIHIVNDMAWINVDWLEALDLEMPTNTDELMTVLEAFKKDDPNGNGEADEIPLSFIDNPGNEDFKILVAAFGGDGDNDEHLVVKDNGSLNFTADDDEYRKAIEYFHELDSKGLIDPEAFEHDWNAYIAKGKEHQYGIYFTWDKANVSGMNDSYDVLPVMEGPDGVQRITPTNNMGFSRDRVVITSANKNPEVTAAWLDKMYEPLQSVQNNWGTYGDEEQQNIFELSENENGEPMLKHLPLEGTAPGELRQKTEVGGGLAILDKYYGVNTTMPDDARWRLDLIEEYYADHVQFENTYPRVFLSEEDSERIAQIEADLMPYVERMRAEFIKSGISDEAWEAYKAELNRLGLEEWLEIKNKNYQATRE